MARRTAEERRRAAEERAAQRAARERGEDVELLSGPEPEPEPDPGYEPDPDAYEAHAFEPLPPTRRTRTIPPDQRQPLSRAAKAQRIGRPGRPTLPPASPKPGAGSAASSR